MNKMKDKCRFATALLFAMVISYHSVNAQSKHLRLVFIRHAEKPRDGENLSCKGFNRSILLPDLLFKKFGVPTNIYVPSIDPGESTKHCRMFQTITPFAVKFNLAINSEYNESDSKNIGNALLKEKGTIIIVWEHKAMLSVIRHLGITSDFKWPDDDFDSIWIVTFEKGRVILTKDKEGLKPSDNCSF